MKRKGTIQIVIKNPGVKEVYVVKTFSNVFEYMIQLFSCYRSRQANIVYIFFE